jgi:hypothetical protein
VQEMRVMFSELFMGNGRARAEPGSDGTNTQSCVFPIPQNRRQLSDKGNWPQVSRTSWWQNNRCRRILGGGLFRHPPVYYRPTNLLLLPLLISAVSLVYKQNYVQLNINLPAPKSTLLQLKILTSNLSFYPNSVS